ncbi:hypothetical protein SEEH1566_05997, partial [Salmonella enterica subsp. enterica serovar Heidelberg str. 41566]
MRHFISCVKLLTDVGYYFVVQTLVRASC